MESHGSWPRTAAERRSLARVVAYAVVTRAAGCLMLYYVVKHGVPRIHPRAHHFFTGESPLAVWLRWDTWWYVAVVEDGYSFSPGHASNVAFLPGYPALIALLKPLMPSPVAALVVSNVAFAGSLLVLWAWVRDRAGLQAAERSALLFLLYPLSFFMNTAYAEAPFFLLCLLSLRSVDRDAWGAAGVYAALATVTRPTGLFLAVAFAVEYWRRSAVGRAPRGGLLAVVLPTLSLLPYTFYLWAAHGSPLAFLEAQRAGWSVGSTFELFQLPYRTDYDVATLDVLNFLLPFVLAVLVALAWRRLGTVSGVYAGLAAALGIALGGQSLGREALAVIPAFAVAGIEPRRRLSTLLFALFGFALLVIFVHAYAMGRFLG